MDLSNNGGLVVSDELRRLLNQPGFISLQMNGQRSRALYCDGSLELDEMLLSDFGRACYYGALDDVRVLFHLGQVPNLAGTETAYKFGYATLLVGGAQRVSVLPGTGLKLEHNEILKFLISRGLDVDVPDIAGYTALFHTMANKILRLDLAKTLLEAGANVDHQNRYGETAMNGAFQHNHPEAVDLLMEWKADLSIPDADGLTSMEFFLNCGPQITATVRKWLKKMNGEGEAPLTQKRCDYEECGVMDKPLKNCGRCKVARYCSVECQRKHWKAHKPICQSFNPATTVTVRPRYKETGTIMPVQQLTRNALGIPTPPLPATHLRGAHIPKKIGEDGKGIIIKVQVPWTGSRMAAGFGDLLIYTKKRDLVCLAQRSDDPMSYDRLCKVIKEKGPGGAKAYFAAELKSKDELVIKISEVLADQPF
ncbi:ankyrin [Pluteus cervinus]|uniref:Ankyrin n=1 Tax=Pluteus cervinus TaxID=181527 RepID=A0ACD3AKZ2_9AGAR|nr:ankyrin [Pluteus cervinus]